MPDQLGFLPERVFTAAAMPGAGYRVEFFQSGTTTPVTVYTTAALSVAHPSPLVCDANGVFPAVFSAGGAIKAVITKPDGSSFYTLDPVFRVSTSGAGASEISFNPTGPLPFNNVQDAIEGAAASAASGFTPFGLGVTGTNALIANLDATNTASGSYRFDNTTTGTFPTGVTAANTGTVQIDRENSGDAVMFLQSGAADRCFFRRMASSTWGAWQEVITVPQGAAEGDIIYRGSSAWLRLAKGTAGQLLRMNSGATAPEWAAGGAFTYITPVTSFSGTSTDITTSLSGVNEIVIHCENLGQTGTSGSNYVLFQLRDSAFVTTGYTSATGHFSNLYTDGSGLPVIALGGANFSGTMRLNHLGGNKWHATHVGATGGSGQVAHGFGYVTLGSALTGVRVTATAGQNLDSGTVTLGWR